MKIFFAVLSLAIVFLSALTASAEKIVFATTEFPPYIIVDGDNLSGLQVEVVRELCRRLGIEPEIRVFPWIRALNSVKEGTADSV